MRVVLVLAVMAAFLTSPLWATGLAAGGKSFALAPKLQPSPQRQISFYNTHTHETLTLTLPSPVRASSTLRDINFFLRDHRNGKTKEMDEGLMALLYAIKTELMAQYPDIDPVFHVISGYRSPETNEMLRRTRGGQAKKSRHIHGDAIDIRVPGVDLKVLRNIAWCQQQGGVGYYSGSQFIHVDTHRVRFWGWSPSRVSCDKVLS